MGLVEEQVVGSPLIFFFLQLTTNVGLGGFHRKKRLVVCVSSLAEADRS